jgi:hypothetical protein
MILFVGNTMNVQKTVNDPCFILTNSSANLNLNSGDTILKAYLYWAGSFRRFSDQIKYCRYCFKHLPTQTGSKNFSSFRGCYIAKYRIQEMQFILFPISILSFKHQYIAITEQILPVGQWLSMKMQIAIESTQYL